MGFNHVPFCLLFGRKTPGVERTEPTADRPQALRVLSGKYGGLEEEIPHREREEILLQSSLLFFFFLSKTFRGVLA